MAKKQLNDVIGPSKGIRTSIWCLSNKGFLSAQPAIDGKCTIVYRSFWGDKNRTVAPIHLENPTYKDLWIACEKLIVESKDTHHVFIENIMYNEDDDVWELVTGS